MRRASDLDQAPASVPLPPLAPLPGREMAGPNAWTNWVIKGRVMAGAFPAALDDAETDRILTLLLSLGINTFVCLQAELNINTPETAWRYGHGLRPYIKDAQRLLGQARESGDSMIQQQKIDFLHLPILDGNVTTDVATHRLAEDCIDRVLRGQNLYIHCWGGHGRTGTLVAIMLGRLYNLPYTAAIRYCQAFHDSRANPQGVRSPQTPVQRAQVRRLLTLQPTVSHTKEQPLGGMVRPNPEPTPGHVAVAARPAAPPVVPVSKPSGGFSSFLNGGIRPSAHGQIPATVSSRPQPAPALMYNNANRHPAFVNQAPAGAAKSAPAPQASSYAVDRLARDLPSKMQLAHGGGIL